MPKLQMESKTSQDTKTRCIYCRSQNEDAERREKRCIMTLPTNFNHKVQMVLIPPLGNQ